MQQKSCFFTFRKSSSFTVSRFLTFNIAYIFFIRRICPNWGELRHELGTKGSLTLCFIYLIHRQKKFPAHSSLADENVTPQNIHEEPKTFHIPETFVMNVSENFQYIYMYVYSVYIYILQSYMYHSSFLLCPNCDKIFSLRLALV